MSVDPARLYSALLNTGLQSKDPPLYQVINQLIGALVAPSTPSGSSNAGGSSTIIENNITDILGGPIFDGIDGLDGIGIPGIQGVPGNTGQAGNPGVSILPLDGEPGEDGMYQQITPANFSGVIQTVQATSTSVVSSTDATYKDCGLSLIITPVSALSRVRLQVILNVQLVTGSPVPQLGIKILNVTAGTTVATFGNAAVNNVGTSLYLTIPEECIDSPATTSPTTYKVQFAQTGGNGTASIGTNVVNNGIAGISTFTAEEILAAGQSLVGQTGAPGPQGVPSAIAMDGDNGLDWPPMPGIPGPAGPTGTSGVFTEQTTTATGNNTIDLNAHLTYLRCNNASLLTIQGMTVLGAAPSAGDTVIIDSINAQVDLPHQNGSATAADRLINFVTSGLTSLAAGIGTSTYRYDGTTLRWRLIEHEQGKAIDYAATSTIVGWSSFTGGRKFIWYYLKGNKLSITVMLEGTSNSTFVSVTFPYTALAACAASEFTGYLGFGYDNGIALVNPGDLEIMGNTNTIGITAVPNGNIGIGSWTASGTKIVQGSIELFVD